MFTESQIQTLAPDDASLKAGKGLSGKNQWVTSGFSERSIWGEIKGSGSKPYQTQVDINTIAFKCTCPSRKFPCKHGIGLMLFWANDPSSITKEKEPSWVEEWMNKRLSKSEKPSEIKELSEEDIIKAEKSKQKRADDRMIAVKAGVEELSLWINDLVRTGILQLQNHERSFFEKTASRMIDSKASGLASWVRSLGNINYTKDIHIWQNEALVILSKIHLIICGFENLTTLPENWQHSIRSLIGWSQSLKELLADETAQIIKDTWIVVGQESTHEEDIIIQKSWLIGINHGKTALILNFGTRFAPLDISLINGTIFEAGLVFFPTIWQQRAVLKLQNKEFNELPSIPPLLNGFTDLYDHISDILAIYPLATDIINSVASVRLVNDNGTYKALDKSGYIMEFHKDFSLDKVINWLAISGGDFLDISVLVRNHFLIPLGVFQENKYVLL